MEPKNKWELPKCPKTYFLRPTLRSETLLMFQLDVLVVIRAKVKTSTKTQHFIAMQHVKTCQEGYITWYQRA